MLKNYFKIAWRNLVRQKAFSLINVLGLSVGLACCLILLAFVKHEKSYDAPLTLMISYLGLLGLSIFTAESKRKEIGIRRVLGASALTIVNKLTSEFLILISVSLLIALPLGYYLMQEWLSHFAYQVPISIWFFLLSAAISVILTYSTVSIQSLKTALSNPIDAIKNE